MSKAIERPVCPCFSRYLKRVVGLLRGAEAGEHAHRPRLRAVHRRLDAARVRILARHAQIAPVVEVSGVLRRIEPLDRHAGLRGDIFAALRHPLGGGRDRRRAPTRAAAPRLRSTASGVKSVPAARGRGGARRLAARLAACRLISSLRGASAPASPLRRSCIESRACAPRRLAGALHLDRHRHRAAAAQAERRQATPTAAPPQLVDQRRQHARAARADGVPQRHRAAVGVDLAPSPSPAPCRWRAPAPRTPR